jgi:hypothetical protein
MFDDYVKIIGFDESPSGGTRAVMAFSTVVKLERGERYTVDINKWQPRRSLPQNALLHALCAEIARLTGMDRELVKQGIKEQYGPKVKGLHGKLYPKPSHLCDKMEMADLIMGAEVELSESGGDPRKIT